MVAAVLKLWVLLTEIHTTPGTPIMQGGLLPETHTIGIPLTESHQLLEEMHTEIVDGTDPGVIARHVPDTMIRLLSTSQDYVAISVFFLNPGLQLLVTAGLSFHAASTGVAGHCFCVDRLAHIAQ